VVPLYEDLMIYALEIVLPLHHSLHNVQELPIMIDIVLLTRGVVLRVEGD